MIRRLFLIPDGLSYKLVDREEVIEEIWKNNATCKHDCECFDEISMEREHKKFRMIDDGE